LNPVERDPSAVAARRNLTEAEAKRLLASRGVSVPAFRVVRSPEEAADAAASLGFPVAVKVASPDILHKSDVGGVVLNVATPGQAREAFDRVMASARAARPEARVEAALVETMCPPGGVEVIVGLVRDPLFGPVVMFGLGGVFVEILKDVSFRVAPIDRKDAGEMLSELQGARLLEGARGRPPVDRDALVDLLLAVAGPKGLAVEPDGEAVAELDLNPIFSYPNGLVVADARIILDRDEGPVAKDVDPEDLKDVMRTVFYPRSMAVVGASPDEEKLGSRALRNFKEFGFKGSLYGIHPRERELYGCKTFPRLADLPERVERVVVTVPKSVVPDIVRQCVENDVRVVHIYTAGYGELDAEGRQAEKELLAQAAGSRLRLLGPNCLGTYVPSHGMTLIAGSEPEAGHISVVSQSGGMTYDMVKRGCHQGLRFSKAISIGNSIDLEPVDFLEYYAQDPDTKVMGGYIEAVRDGRRLRRALEMAVRNEKPVVLLKGGQTSSGQRAAASHTGAMASDFAVWRALFRQYGVSQVQSLEELLDTLLAFQMLPPVKGRGVSLIGPGGGVSVTSTDAAERHGLVVAPFTPGTVAALKALELPPGTSLVNPLDVPAGVLRVQKGTVLGKVLRAAVADPGIDALVVHLNLISIIALASLDVTAGYTRNMVSAVIELKSLTDRPLCLVLRSSGEPDSEEIVRRERERALAAGVPVYPCIEDALRPLGHMYRYYRFRQGLADRY